MPWRELCSRLNVRYQVGSLGLMVKTIVSWNCLRLQKQVGFLIGLILSFTMHNAKISCKDAGRLQFKPEHVYLQPGMQGFGAGGFPGESRGQACTLPRSHTRMLSDSSSRLSRFTCSLGCRSFGAGGFPKGSKS